MDINTIGLILMIVGAAFMVAMFYTSGKVSAESGLTMAVIGSASLTSGFIMFNIPA